MQILVPQASPECSCALEDCESCHGRKVIGLLLGQLQAVQASRQAATSQADGWSWAGEKLEAWEQSPKGDETLIGPDGAVYDVFYPGISCPDEKEETSTTCSDSGGSPGPLPRARSAESSIAGVVDFIRSAAVARYPAREKLYDVVHRAAQTALGSHFQRLALIGSTALRIDTPDSDLDVVVYTCRGTEPPAAAESFGSDTKTGSVTSYQPRHGFSPDLPPSVPLQHEVEQAASREDARKAAKGPHCGDCGKALIGLPRLRPIEYSRLKKREKHVNRAYGGSRCAHCVRERIVRAFLIEEQKCVKQVLAEKLSQAKEKEGGSSYYEDGTEVPAPDPIEALYRVTAALGMEDPALKLQLVDCARVPVLTVLSADGRLSLDLTVDQPLGEWHVLWFKSLWQWDPCASDASVKKLPPPLQDGELDGWSSGLEATALRCIKWWLRRRNIPVPKEGGYPTVVWTLMVLHVLRCTLFVNGDSKQERCGRTLLSALAAFFDRFATPGASSGTLSFCMGPDGMSTAFEPIPAYEDTFQCASDETYGGLSVLDPTTTCETSVAFGVVPSELAPQLPAATRLLQAYELQRAQRLSATALASCCEEERSSSRELGAEALEELFMETATPCNTMPAAAPSQPVSVIVLRDGELAVGILQKVVPKHGWTAPFLHRRDGVSSFAVQLCEVRESDGLLTPWEPTVKEHWYYACDFVCLAALQPVFTRGQCRGKHLRRERNRWKVDPEGLERWQKMQALLSQVGLHH
ncbi:RPL34B [Symbiodinium sp. CCMP2592]|nr:RPL34B [Symbiodinium sp. CCMP2592]